MVTGFDEWEKEQEEAIPDKGRGSEAQINEEQQPEFDILGTALNEL